MCSRSQSVRPCSPRQITGDHGRSRNVCAGAAAEVGGKLGGDGGRWRLLVAEHEEELQRGGGRGGDHRDGEDEVPRNGEQVAAVEPVAQHRAGGAEEPLGARGPRWRGWRGWRRRRRLGKWGGGAGGRRGGQGAPRPCTPCRRDRRRPTARRTSHCWPAPRSRSRSPRRRRPRPPPRRRSRPRGPPPTGRAGSAAGGTWLLKVLNFGAASGELLRPW